MQTDQITIRVPQALADAYRSASPERQRKMELYMTLRLKAYEGDSDASFEEAWARLGEEAEAHGLDDEKVQELLREIDQERDAHRGDDASHLGDGLPEAP